MTKTFGDELRELVAAENAARAEVRSRAAEPAKRTARAAWSLLMKQGERAGMRFEARQGRRAAGRRTIEVPLHEYPILTQGDYAAFLDPFEEEIGAAAQEEGLWVTLHSVRPSGTSRLEVVAEIVWDRGSEG